MYCLKAASKPVAIHILLKCIVQSMQTVIGNEYKAVLLLLNVFLTVTIKGHKQYVAKRIIKDIKKH